MLRNNASGPEIGLPGRIWAGLLPGKHRPAFGRPEDRFRCFPGSSPAEIRPGRPISGPEALLRNVEYLILKLAFCFGHPEGGQMGPHPDFPSISWVYRGFCNT